MKICYFADGRYIHALRWMRYFAAKGHEMHLISFAEVDPEQIAELEAAGIKYHGHTGNFHVKKFWLTLRDLRFVRSVLKREKIDILHSHFLGPNAWYGALSGFHPHIITIMGGDVLGQNWTPGKNIQEKKLTPYSLRNADALTAWSMSLLETIKPFSGDQPMEVVHGGVDLARFSPGKKPRDLIERLSIGENANVVFSPRLLRRLYNIDQIAHAAGHVCDKLPETYFIFAMPSHISDDEYVQEIRAIIDKNAACGRVLYVPAIAHNEIVDYFRLADVTVSIPATDGTPMAVLESMACGTPTVIGNLSEYDRDYFEHEKTTVLVDVNDPKSIAEGIVRLLTDKQFSAEIVSEAVRRVKETGGYEFQMEKMERMYQRFNAN